MPSDEFDVVFDETLFKKKADPNDETFESADIKRRKVRALSRPFHP